MIISDLPTPSVLIERRRLEANLSAMQDRADRTGVVLRPHIKTHKSVALARRQQALGARGLTVAKPSEAEVFVDAGFDDVRIAYSLAGAHRYPRLLRLMDRARISFCVDTPEGARAASAFFADRGRTVDVLVEVDCGYGRCGVPWNDEALVDFARLVTELPGLRLVGILTHAGQSYKGPTHEAETAEQSVHRVMVEERGQMLSAAVRLRRAGVPGVEPGRFEISIGSTPTMSCFENKEREGFTITEIRPGNYVFNDAIQLALGVARPEACALTVLATVVSRHRDRSGRERLFLDAGKKVLTSDTGYGTRGYGIVLHSARTMKPLPHARIEKLSEEHGWVFTSGGSSLDVGDRVRIVPNHACVVVNTRHRLVVVDGEDVVDTWTVDAQGCVE